MRPLGWIEEVIMHVAVRELKSSLSRILSLAREGEVIEVTSRNRPIARIVGIPPHTDAPLGDLIAAGALSWRSGKPCFAPPVELVADGVPVSQMVQEGRD